MVIITVTELKKYIYENNKIPFILEQIGCHHILYHQGKEYYSCGNYNGDNPAAINVKNNDYLNCRNYTREKEFDEQADLITLVQYNKQIDFIAAFKWLHTVLNLPFTNTKQKQKETSKTEIDPLYIFKKVKNKKPICDVLNYEILDEDVLNDFVPYIHISWYREGIMPWTVKKFGLCYSFRRKRNVIPLRHWLTGELLGFNQRTVIENYELFDIPKYFISPNYKKQNNIYGLWENLETIKAAGYVVVYESEKSVLKRHSLNDGTGVAISGHIISDEQVRILSGLGVEIVIAMDKDIELCEVRNMCNKFYGVRKVSYIWDKYNLLGEKDSPADARNKIFEFLFKYRVKFDAKERTELKKELDI